MKIYTKTGDNGTSALNDGCRTAKASPIFSVLGELDELSSRIGVLCSFGCLTIDNESFLRKIQSNIHTINAHIASPTRKSGKNIPPIDNSIIPIIEHEIDKLDQDLPALTNFIAPGVFAEDAHAHLCRTQTRKVERKLWKLGRTRNIPHLEKHIDGDTEIINIFSEINKNRGTD